MLKKLLVAFLLTIVILAFPVRLLEISPNLKAILKIFKGVVFISLIFLLMSKEGFLKRQFIFQKIRLSIFIKLLPVILLIATYVIYFLSTTLEAFQGPASLLVLTLAGTLVAASAEEIIFRGYVMNLFRKNGYSLIRSLVFSSLFFSLIHIINVFQYQDLWPLFNQVMFAFATGMLFGAIYALTQNLLLVCIFHFLVNVPSAIESLLETSAADIALSQQATFLDNILSSIFFLILTVPVLILASYYIKIANTQPVKKNENGNLALVE